MNNINKIFENNHHFQEYEFGDVHDFFNGILSTVQIILGEQEKKDPNFRNYKYCIINGKGDPQIKIPEFLKDKTETVEKTKKFLGFTIKKWTENIDKKYILNVESPWLMNYETQFNWLDEIEHILIVVPISKIGIDLVRIPGISDSSTIDEKYFYSYDLTKAYGWVVRNTCLLNPENDKLIAPILALNLTDYVYNIDKHKLEYKNFNKNFIDSHRTETTVAHELMHLYDAYKILSSNKKKVFDRLGKTGISYLKLDVNAGDKEFITAFNSFAYQLDDTEMNAFNNGIFPNITKFIEDYYPKRILNSKDINYLAEQIKDSDLFKDVSIFYNTNNEEIKQKLGVANIEKIIAYERFRGTFNHIEKFKDNNKKVDYFLNAVKLYYKKRAIKIYNKRLNILYEVVKIHNKDMESNKIHENYGYPAIMNHGMNGGNSALNLMGYQYQLLPLNDYYQQKPNKDPGAWQYIHMGSEIKSYTKGSEPREVIGRIIKMDKNEAGEYSKICVLEQPNSENNNETKVVEIDIDKMSLVSHYHPKRMYKKR